MFTLTNLLWFGFGLLGLVLSFYMALPGNPKPSAVIEYIKTYPRIAIFNMFAYVFFIAMWLDSGLFALLPKGHLNYLSVPLAWVAATFFHQVIKNFSTAFGGLIGKMFGVTNEGNSNGNPPPPNNP